MSLIVRHLTSVSRCGREYRKQFLEPLGLPGQHGRFLMEVCDHPGISQEHLARRLLVDKSSITRQGVSLAADGYILRKTCDEDRRVIRLYPTEKTLSLLPQLSLAWDSWESIITADLSEEERRALTALLQKMKASAREWMEAH